MKKLLISLLGLILLTSCAEGASSQPTETYAVINNAGAISSDITEESATPTVSEVQATETELNDVDEFDPENYVPPVSDEPMAICNLFPDPFFALQVAGLFDKEVTDVVTFEELAGYTGELSCGPGLIKSIEGIGYLTGITSFTNAKNDLGELPDDFGKLVNLKSINLLKSYAFRRISPEIKNLKALEYFRADLTGLEELPSEIGELENLRVLIIDNTNLTSIPDEIGNLRSLEYLDMHSTGIEVVPDSLCNLLNLEALDISYTGLKELPDDIGNLTELTRLDLFGCELKELPESIKNLDKLRYLNVYDNFDLSEKYKDWFSASVYECTDDPEDDIEWFSKW